MFDWVSLSTVCVTCKAKKRCKKDCDFRNIDWWMGWTLGAERSEKASVALAEWLQPRTEVGLLMALMNTCWDPRMWAATRRNLEVSANKHGIGCIFMYFCLSSFAMFGLYEPITFHRFHLVTGPFLNDSSEDLGITNAYTIEATNGLDLWVHS